MSDSDWTYPVQFFCPVRTASPREAKSLDLAQPHGTLFSELPHYELPLFLL